MPCNHEHFDAHWWAAALMQRAGIDHDREVMCASHEGRLPRPIHLRDQNHVLTEWETKWILERVVDRCKHMVAQSEMFVEQEKELLAKQAETLDPTHELYGEDPERAQRAFDELAAGLADNKKRQEAHTELTKKVCTDAQDPQYLADLLVRVTEEMRGICRKD